MALNNFPYTNFHELNADWIISKIKEYETSLLSQYAELVELRTIITTYGGTIEDIQGDITTINSKIDDLQNQLDSLGAGILPQSLIDNILNYVRANLPELLSPYNTAITDLTYNKMNAGLNNPFNARDPDYGTWSSFDDLTRPGTYRINLNEGDSPTTPTHYPLTATLNNGVLAVFNSSLNTNSWGVNTTLQIYAESNNVWYRLYIKAPTSGGNSYWTAWTQIALKSDITNINGSISNLTSQISTINSTVNGHTLSIERHTTQLGHLQTQDNALRDMIIANQGHISDLENSKQGTNNGTASQADFNDITTPGSYWIRPDTTTQNAPVNSYGLLNVTRSSSNVILQSFTQTNLRFYQRIFFNNVWSAWQEYTRA